MSILITGGTGFIGYNFINVWSKQKKERIINLDKSQYTKLQSLEVKKNKKHYFYNTNISNINKIKLILKKHKPRAIVHFAADTHVDNSIKSPMSFIKNNIFNSSIFLNEVFNYWVSLKQKEKSKFRFINVSTDEVFGELGFKDKKFTEKNSFKPRNPYSASKAAFDHLCSSYFSTFRFPVITTHCSNNFGPFQIPEKMIPLFIMNALNNKYLPIYGNGKQIRDWIFVEDHCLALILVLENSKIGEIYNIGASNEKTNISLANKLCAILDKIHPNEKKISYKKLIKKVTDRLGHDKRYAINSNKIKKELNWSCNSNFYENLTKTIKWYLMNKNWIKEVSRKL